MDQRWGATSAWFGPEQPTPDGWRLPLSGKLTGYLYVGLVDFAFEVWLGGDFDVTVRLERPFTYGHGERPASYDPRTADKAELGPLLELSAVRVAEFAIKQVGILEITFSDHTRLVARPADDGPAWRLEWPVAGEVRVAARAGGGLTWPQPDRAANFRRGQATDLPADLAPIRRGGVLELPVRGLVALAPLSGASIEFMIPIPDIGDYCVHFGGGLEMTDAVGNVWRGNGDPGVRASLAPVLGLVGKHVLEAHVDAAERLHLAFADGARVVADRDTWEAHWPTGPGLDEHWVPREGPNIP